ncbi:hypothetical protein HanRHA438_Chr03g0123741 [Helianthus annuus]|nr:hypothetical protein HanRHA438_Chr03g0123741 [Helianthus annuus]
MNNRRDYRIGRSRVILLVRNRRHNQPRPNPTRQAGFNLLRSLRRLNIVPRAPIQFIHSRKFINNLPICCQFRLNRSKKLFEIPKQLIRHTMNLIRPRVIQHRILKHQSHIRSKIQWI